MESLLVDGSQVITNNNVKIRYRVSSYLLNVDAMACATEYQTCAHCLCKSSSLMRHSLACFKRRAQSKDPWNKPDLKSPLDPL